MMTAMNRNTNMITPATLIAFKIGSGHLLHKKLAVSSYLASSNISHSAHSSPLYPFSH